MRAWPASSDNPLRGAACAGTSGSRSQPRWSPPATATARTVSGAPAPAPRRTAESRRRLPLAQGRRRAALVQAAHGGAEAVLRTVRLALFSGDPFPTSRSRCVSARSTAILASDLVPAVRRFRGLMGAGPRRWPREVSAVAVELTLQPQRSRCSRARSAQELADHRHRHRRRTHIHGLRAYVPAAMIIWITAVLAETIGDRVHL